MNKPLVSVILTTCGRVPLLQQSIQSVLSQEGFGGNDLELVVVCDNEWPERFYNKIVNDVCLEAFHPIEIAYAELLAGPDDGKIKRLSQMINLGLEVAHGKFVTYLCDDDVWLPGRLDRLFTMAQLGADWVVDRVRWMRPDGVTVPHDAIGNFMYAKPLEAEHEKLVEALAGLGSNWICHDCVVHRRTEDRWPEVETHTPVDWRFWCSLWKRGLKPKVTTEVGAEAFYPGAWRAGLTIEQAVKARNLGGGNMTKSKKVKTDMVQYAINTGSQIENVPTMDGKGKQVPPEGRIDIRLVTTPSGELFPAFVPEGSTSVPALMPKTDPDFLKEDPDFLKEDEWTDEANAEAPVAGPLVSAGPKKKKKSFKLIKKKGAPESFDKRPAPDLGIGGEIATRKELEILFKSELVSMLNSAKIPGASMSKTKKVLIDMILEAGL